MAMTTYKLLVPLPTSAKFALCIGTFFIIAWIIYYVFIEQRSNHTSNAWYGKSKTQELPVQGTFPIEHLVLNSQPFLPSAWWTDEKVFELERRAILSRVSTDEKTKGALTKQI
jgi:hypothetical protein